MSLGIPATVVVAVGSTEAAKVFSGQPPTMTPVLAGFGLGIALYAISSLDTGLGHMFCILVVIGSLLINGQEIFTRYSSVLAARTKAGK